MSTDRNTYPAGTIEVRGTDFAVTVNQGMFAAETDGRQWRADTLDGLRTLIMRATATSAAKISVPFSYLRGPVDQLQVVKGEVTGIHGGTGNLMISWRPGEGAKQQTNYLSGTQLRPLDGDECEEWIRLSQALAAAKQALADFTGPRELILSMEASEAVKRALKPEADPS